MAFFPRGDHLKIESQRLDLYNVFSCPIPSMCLMGFVPYYYLHHLTFSYPAKRFLVLLSEQEPPSKNIKLWTTRSSLNIEPSKSRAGLGRAGRNSATQVAMRSRSFSLWSDGFFLSLILWVFGDFFFFFLNLDFRWLLGVDLVECFVLADLCLCFVLAEISWNFIFLVWMNKSSLWASIYKSSF